MPARQILQIVHDLLTTYQRDAPQMSGAVANVITVIEIELQKSKEKHHEEIIDPLLNHWPCV